jgi:KaiC/GvpD/RAD55 family RecA-like ATPase
LQVRNKAQRGRDFLDALRQSKAQLQPTDPVAVTHEPLPGFTPWHPSEGIVLATITHPTPAQHEKLLLTTPEGVHLPKPDQLRPLKVGELISKPPTPWIIRHLIPERGFGVIYGAPASGKTFLILDIAAAVARGTPWRDLRTKQGGVIYVACEGTLTNRLKAYLQYHQLEEEALDNLRVIASSVNLLDPDADTKPLIHHINEMAMDVGSVALVVVDTLNRAMAGGDENTSTDMGTMIAAAGRITESTGATVIFVHHCGKEVEKGARGHSSLKAAVDFEMAISCGKGDVCYAEATKIKDGESGSRYGFRLVAVDLGASRDPSADPGERETSCVIEAADAPVATARELPRSEKALEVLRGVVEQKGQVISGYANIPDHVRVVKQADWKLAWRSRLNYGKGSSADTNFGKDKKALVTSGKIGMEGDWVWLTEPLPS